MRDNKTNDKTSKTIRELEVSLISLKYGRESLSRAFVFILSTITSLSLIVYGVINSNAISTIIGVFLTAIIIINSSRPMKIGNELDIHHQHIFNKARLFSSLFVVGILVTATAILFNEPYTFLTGLMVTIVSILFFKIEQYKHDELIKKKIHKKRTFLASFLLIIGIVLTYIGLKWDLSSLFLLGVVLAIYDLMYLVGSHFKQIMKK